MNILKKIIFNTFLVSFIFGTKNIFSQQSNNFFMDFAQINNQIWSTKNLDVVVFQNGDTILHAPSLEEWIAAAEKGIPAWCYYNNDPELGEKTGKLYNWYAANDKRNIAPKGWKVPNSKDIRELLLYIESDYYTTSRLASKEWTTIAAEDKYGFNAKPYGGRFISLYKIISTPDTTIYNPKTRFGSMGRGVGYWLSDSPKEDNTEGYAFLLNLEELTHIYGCKKEDGLYIRCIKEYE